MNQLLVISLVLWYFIS
uniref:Uncharacterized protein n=1 Tax=Rhizophora mucronata TaxID=61149 RepID=A0A2P2N0D9_RHIMU